jgi:AraC-like DNA-binding protein
MDQIKLPKYDGIEPIVYSVYLDDVPPGAKNGPMLRSTYIIECNESGYGSVIINGVEFPVKPRDCYIILPGQMTAYTAHPINPRKGIFCNIGGMRVGQILAEIGVTPSNPYVPGNLFDEIRGQLYRMLELKKDNDRGADFRRSACIYEILGILTRNRTEGDDYWIQKALGIFESEYEKKISVSDVAAEVGFERSYFSTIFREKTGVSPHAYLTSLRVAKACVLLNHSLYSVSEIAESVGLDSGNFARLFKREMGISPLEYRKKIL